MSQESTEFNPNADEDFSDIYERARIAEQAEEQRKAEQRRILAEQFSEIAQDQEVQTMTKRSVYKILEELEKLLRELVKTDYDDDRKSYVNTQILRWAAKQVVAEEKRISLIDRM